MAAPVREEKVVYLLDPTGASRRSAVLRTADQALRSLGLERNSAWSCRTFRRSCEKSGGMMLSLGQFMSSVGGELMASGAVQIWPGTPVAEALIERTIESSVGGVRLPIRAWTATGNRKPASCPAWTCTRR